jgi:hypothetical protein
MDREEIAECVGNLIFIVGIAATIVIILLRVT